MIKQNLLCLKPTATCLSFPDTGGSFLVYHWFLNTIQNVHLITTVTKIQCQNSKIVKGDNFWSNKTQTTNCIGEYSSG